MINNRQNGRRRGRGGQRVGGGNPGRPESGNRIDSRARGNASQLHEKYKTLAADAQRQGDRVNTEYYLQFADHYFRVLAESRPRVDEQQQARARGRDDYDDEFDGDGEEYGQEGEPGQPDQYQPRADDRPRQDGRYQDGRHQEGRQGQDERPRYQPARGAGDAGQEARPRRDERPRQDSRPEGGQDSGQDGRPKQADRQGERPRREDRIRRDAGSDARPREDRLDHGTAAPVEAAALIDQLPTDAGAIAGVDDRLTAPQPATDAASTVRAADMEAPAPRRRGRPPKVRTDEAPVVDAAEPAGFDADRLPPSLSVSASAEPDAGEPAEKPRRRRRLSTEGVEAG